MRPTSYISLRFSPLGLNVMLPDFSRRPLCLVNTGIADAVIALGHSDLVVQLFTDW